MTNLERDLFSLISLVSNVTEAYSACLFLESKRQRAFQLTAFHSLSPHIEPDATVEAGQGFMGWVLENNEPLSIDQFDKDTIVLGYYSRNEDIKSFMATPVPSSRTRGALAVDSKKQWSFTPKSQKLLAGFAQQFAHLVDGALAEVQRERRCMDLAAFSSYLDSLRSAETEDQLLSAICLVPRDLLPFDGCFLVLKDEGETSGRLVRTTGFGELFLGDPAVSGHASVAGYVLGKGESLRLPDLRGQNGKRPLFHPAEPNYEARSVVVVPLIAGGRTLGALGFTAKRRGQFDLGSLRRAEVLAGPAADALERLGAEKKWREREERDPVTGGYNLHHLRRRLGDILRDADARGRQISLLTVAPDDLDEFPGEENLAAHEAFIQHLWRQLEPFGRGGDLVVRHEGARFVLLLNGSSLEYAEAVADGAIREINENPFVLGGGREITVTASVGVACFPEDEGDPERLLSASFRALASARTEGINQLCLHGGA
ncbi:MAG: GAF domain-containing protein [bacterium]